MKYQAYQYSGNNNSWTGQISWGESGIVNRMKPRIFESIEGAHKRKLKQVNKKKKPATARKNLTE